MGAPEHSQLLDDTQPPPTTLNNGNSNPHENPQHHPAHLKSYIPLRSPISESPPPRFAIDPEPASTTARTTPSIHAHQSQDSAPDACRERSGADGSEQGETSDDSEVGEDVMVIQEICRQLKVAERVRRDSGFGYPVKTMDVARPKTARGWRGAGSIVYRL
jgi:hypothetical protein